MCIVTKITNDILFMSVTYIAACTNIKYALVTSKYRDTKWKIFEDLETVSYTKKSCFQQETLD